MTTLGPENYAMVWEASVRCDQEKMSTVCSVFLFAIVTMLFVLIF